MITPVTQRWKLRRGVYRPSREPVRKETLDIVRSCRAKTLKAFVRKHHYSRSCSSIVRGFELHQDDELVGVAIFSTMARQFKPPAGEKREWLTLDRLVLLDQVGANAETIFLGEAFAQLRAEGYVGVVSFSDPEPRTTISGRVIFTGHIGGIYQAHNGLFTGRSKAETKTLLPDGTIFDGRAASKVRKGERGQRYARQILERFGATPLQEGEDPAEWLRLWKTKLGRPFRHRGNLRYLWGLDRRVRRLLPAGLPYPKFELARLL
jgi:hypothetical protein